MTSTSQLTFKILNVTKNPGHSKEQIILKEKEKNNGKFMFLYNLLNADKQDYGGIPYIVNTNGEGIFSKIWLTSTPSKLVNDRIIKKGGYLVIEKYNIINERILCHEARYIKKKKESSIMQFISN